MIFTKADRERLERLEGILKHIEGLIGVSRRDSSTAFSNPLGVGTIATELEDIKYQDYSLHKRQRGCLNVP